jgi:hypothetical protein
MKEVSFDAFCDAKSLLLWAKKLLREHREELGGGMYAHADRLEWSLPGEAQPMEFGFSKIHGGARMTVRYSESVEPQFAMVSRWALSTGKVRQADRLSAPPAEGAEQGDLDAEEGFFPADLIQQRWGNYTIDERAYATCLFECVRYEHLIWKHLPFGALEAAERRSHDSRDIGEGANSEASGETAPVETRRSLGFISSIFSNHPEVRPLLEICGTYHHIWLINDFRNSLIHVRTSKQLSPNAIRKRYRRLQMAICLLQRWPWIVKLHDAIQAFDQRRRPQLSVEGPGPHPCRIIKHLGADGLTAYYGLSTPGALRLEQIGALFISKPMLRPEEDYVRAVDDLNQLV